MKFSESLRSRYIGSRDICMTPPLPMNSIRNPIFCNESIQSSDLMNKISRMLRDQHAFELEPI